MAEWKTISEQAQQSVLDAIPDKWRIKHTPTLGEDVSQIPGDCGILTRNQVQITELSTIELLERIRAAKISVVEVVEAFAARAAIAHQLVNCLTDFFLDEALDRARELDQYLAETGSVIGPLHGLPIAIKDSYSLRGHASTFGYISHHDKIVDYDSAVPAILRDSGAIFYVKTAMPQAGMALETMSNLFGRTVNPFNTHLGAGGSSGGDGALVALHGSPLTLSTDIGGSIRIPAAVNGLYGIRPTADRVPKSGMQSVEAGQLSIRVSCGPVGHSIDDLRLLTKLITTHRLTKIDAMGIPFPWSPAKPKRRFVFGLMTSDGVVEPHPPIKRAMREAAAALNRAGHQVVDFVPPFDCWECSKTAFHLYFPTGASESKASIRSSGEPIIPVFKEILDTYNVPPQSAADILGHHRSMFAYKKQFHQAWLKTRELTDTKQPIDALICPVGPAIGIPHDFNIWWGYTTLFNIVDYPSIVLPIKKFKFSASEDAKDTKYVPRTTNPFDRPNFEMYDPELFRKQPMTLQIVGRPFEDEMLIEAAAAADMVLN